MLTYQMDKCGDAPLYKYLYDCIKADIRAEKLLPGSRLPSRRTLAEHLGISTVTVEGAYGLLEAEGYIAARQRSGYFVCDGENMPQADAGGGYTRGEPAQTVETDFPFASLTRIMRRVISQYDRQLLLKAPHNGCEALRRAIASYLRRYRGMDAKAENIIIGSGAEYLYGMVVQLLGRGRVYGLENPSYDKIRAVYAAAGAQCEMLPMDSSGITPAALHASNAQVLHITPYHSFPTGITAPASRRLQYLAWARARDAIIVEDDFDSEFAVGMKPVETVYSMDGDGRVVYINTFSKSLAPSMRMGYMVLSDRLMEEYQEKLGFYSCTVPTYDQYVLAEFIDSGAFERHLNRVRHRIRTEGKK